jgi:GH43 family beta-xylosidase
MKTPPRSLLSALLALFLTAIPAAAEASKTVVFVDGSGDAAASTALSAAFAQLAETGGIIVLRGSVRIDRNFSAPAHAAPVTITSSHEGRDYRLERGAKLVLDGDYTINGPTTFTDLVIASTANASHIHGNGHPVVFAKDISCLPSPAGKFPSITGAAREAGGADGADIIIHSGQWNQVSGSTLQEAGPTRGTLRIAIHGGRFYGTVCATGAGQHAGDAVLTLNDGYFYGGVAGVEGSEDASVRGTVSITVNGGVYYNTIEASHHTKASFTGTYKLAINGGVFTSLVGLTGTRGLPGSATSELIAIPALLDAENKGTLTFTNPLIKGADPWVFQYNGFYYCTTTGGSQLSGRKVANLSDLPYAEPATFFKPAVGQPYSRHLWSPKIYHFSAEDAGEENAGWYLYFTANDGSGRSASDHRLFVLRARTDDPFGPYGSPQEGTPDTPMRVTSAKKNVFNDEWVAGPKVLNYGGKCYLIWVGRVGGPDSKNTGDHWQCLYIDELINPWTVAGHAAMICRPTRAWEKHGAGMTGAGDQRRMLPEVVEGGTPVVLDDGTLYLLYAGSGYWTPHYAIGLMKLVGHDPMNPAHWKKAPAPIFKASAEVVGSANACYVSSPTGKSQWAIYHAYVGKKTRGVPRQLFAEPYVATDQSMAIGRGSPAPLGTPMTIEANPMPLRKKISGFSSLLTSSPFSE